MTLAEIAAELCKLYPDAVSVNLFVNEHEHQVELTYVDKTEYGASYRRLDGQWANQEKRN